MAAIGIVLKIERLPLNIGIGISQGMMPIVAYNYASGNRKRMKDTIAFSRRVGILCAVLSILLYEDVYKRQHLYAAGSRRRTETGERRDRKVEIGG